MKSFALLLVSTASAVAVPRAPNSDILQKGVNLFATGNKPAYTVDIFEFTYSDCIKNYGSVPVLIADCHCAGFLKMSDTSMHSKLVATSSMEDYKGFLAETNSFDASVSIDGVEISSFAGVAFSASDSITKSAEYYHSSANVAMLNTATTTVYQVQMSPYYSPADLGLTKLNAELEMTVQRLPKEYDVKIYCDAIDTVGSHFIKKADMGGNVIQVSAGAAAAFNAVASESGSLEVTATESLLWKTETQHGSATESVSAQQYDAAASIEQYTEISGPAPPSDSPSDYYNVVLRDPYPQNLEYAH